MAGQVERKGWGLGVAILGILILMVVICFAVLSHSPVAYADPIPPPEGFPKLSLSIKTVTPTLAHTGGVTLTYAVEIRNTGAYTAAGTTLTDAFPDGTTYNGDAQASVDPPPQVTSDTLTWQGDVGFDASVVISFSVAVSPDLDGVVRNTAVISHPLIARPVTVTVETVVTDDPILTIEKSAVPPKPGANKPLIYSLVVANQGQPAAGLPITVTDRVPDDTTLLRVGEKG